MLYLFLPTPVVFLQSIFFSVFQLVFLLVVSIKRAFLWYLLSDILLTCPYHERALRITYKDMTSDFDAMLLRDNAVPIHIRNLQLLVTEIYKTKWELNPSFMKEIFVEKRSPYGLRSCDNLQLPQARTTCNGLDTISFRGCRLWQALPNDIKQSNTLSSFKSRIKLWKGEECNCRICRPFVAQVGFLS